MRRVYFESQTHAPFRLQSQSHLLEQVEVLLNGAIPPFAASLGRSVRTNLLFVALADIGLAFFNEVHGEFVNLLELVAAESDLPRFVAEPRHILLNVLDVFDVLFLRIGVVKTEIGLSLMRCSHLEGEAHGLSVSDVQIPIGLRREAR